MSSRSLRICTGRFLRGQWLYCPRDMVESVVSSLSLVTRMPLYHSITMSLQLANTQHRVTESSAPPRPGLALIPTPLHGGTCCPANQRAARRPITGRLAAAPRTSLMRGEAVSAQLAAREDCVTISLSHSLDIATLPPVRSHLPAINSWLFGLGLPLIVGSTIVQT